MPSPTQVPLSSIRSVSRSELEDHKLKSLQDGNFEEALNSRFNPIALDRGSPHDITDGRHRIYLARQKGYKSVPAIFV
jgi:hypothetical protein